MNPGEYNELFKDKIADIIEEDFMYENKLGLFRAIKSYAENAEQIAKNKQMTKKNCPHDNTVNATTLADPEGVKKLHCFDCNQTLIYKEGVLINDENEN